MEVAKAIMDMVDNQKEIMVDFLQKVVILVKVETLIDQHHHHFLQRVVSLVKVVILIGQHLHLAVKVH